MFSTFGTDTRINQCEIEALLPSSAYARTPSGREVPQAVAVRMCAHSRRASMSRFRHAEQPLAAATPVRAARRGEHRARGHPRACPEDPAASWLLSKQMEGRDTGNQSERKQARP